MKEATQLFSKERADESKALVQISREWSLVKSSYDDEFVLCSFS
jgi:hypothetical protein